MTAIYFDHAATTPMHPAAIAAYAEAAGAGPGNPSSLHAYGRASRSRMTAVRDQLADLLGCTAAELVFTGSGTESDNTAIFGVAAAQRANGRTGVVTSAVEHPAVLQACRRLEQSGFQLTILPVDETGRVSVEAAEQAIGKTTALVSIMAGNNETGTLQPIEEIGRIARERGALMHVDAVQAFGYRRWELHRCPFDLLSASAHKFNGPQGVGLLYIRKGTPYRSFILGGKQERSRRAGTQNVPGIAALAAAAEHAFRDLDARIEQANAVRSALLHALAAELPASAYRLNGHPDLRLPHIINISFPGVSAESMLMNLDLSGIAASAGSACSSGSLQLSHVLKAMRLPEPVASSAVRFSFGMGNTIEEAEKTAKIIATIWARIRIS